LQHARNIPGGGPGAPVELFEQRLRDFVLGLALAIERAEPIAGAPTPPTMMPAATRSV